MGQTLERYSSVSEEKKNEAIKNIVEKVYEKYLGKSEIEKILSKPETKKSSESIDNPETSKKTEENPENSKKTEGNQTSKKTEGKNETSKKTEGNLETSKKTEGNHKPSEAKTSKLKANFYMAVCEIVGELNKTFGNTQFKLPNKDHLQEIFKKHHSPTEPVTTEPVTKEVFQKMLQDILKTESVFPGFGAKDALVYIFTVPAAAVLAKQRLFPRAIPNDVLIPGVTSATVFALAKLNKI